LNSLVSPLSCNENLEIALFFHGPRSHSQGEILLTLIFLFIYI
jgi:hypothetical protein